MTRAARRRAACLAAALLGGVLAVRLPGPSYTFVLGRTGTVIRGARGRPVHGPVAIRAAAEDIWASIGASRPLSESQGKVVVVKYGGHAMKDEAAFARDLVALARAGVKPVVVHGGGPMIKAMLERLDLPSKFVQGLRVSDEATVEVAEMVLGRLNKGLVAALVAAGGRAVGLSGKDDGMIMTRRVMADGGEDIGFVGEAEKIDTTLLDSLIGMGVVPVVAPIGVGLADGMTYNINADTMAGAVAGALKADRLLLLTDIAGVLDAAPPEGNLIPRLTRSRIDELIADGTIAGGMIPKVQNALQAVDAGAGGAAIVDGREKHAIFRALFSDSGGTLVESS